MGLKSQWELTPPRPGQLGRYSGEDLIRLNSSEFKNSTSAPQHQPCCVIGNLHAGKLCHWNPLHHITPHTEKGARGGGSFCILVENMINKKDPLAPYSCVQLRYSCGTAAVYSCGTAAVYSCGMNTSGQNCSL